MDKLTRPDEPFQQQMTDVFVQIGLRSQSRWLKKPMKAEQWRRYTRQAFTPNMGIVGVASFMFDQIRGMLETTEEVSCSQGKYYSNSSSS